MTLRGRGRPARQTNVLPDDGFVTINVDGIREKLQAYVAQLPPNIPLGHAIRELIEMSLAMNPNDAAIWAERRRAHTQAQRFVYRSVAAAFAQIQHDLENTSVLLEEMEPENG